MKKGKLIVIDGTDGAGKATQTDLLVKRLAKEGHKVETMSFPQYHTKSAGMAENYLEGKYGSRPGDVSPYAASVLYAVDRFDAARMKIDKWLLGGSVVVLDRYVSANMGHQGTKFKSALERKKFFEWVADFEYRILELPRPDLQLFLYVEPQIGQEMAQKKWEEEGTQKNLAKSDILEADLDHLMKAAGVYREMASFLPDSTLIEVTRDGAMLSREDIHEMIWNLVQPSL